MMTCVSLKSGVASRGSVIIDHHPTKQANAIAASTRALCLTEMSMMRLIMAGVRRIQGQIMRRLLLEILLAALRAEVIRGAITSKRMPGQSGLCGIDGHAASRIFDLRSLSS